MELYNVNFEGRVIATAIPLAEALEAEAAALNTLEDAQVGGASYVKDVYGLRRRIIGLRDTQGNVHSLTISRITNV